MDLSGDSYTNVRCGQYKIIFRSERKQIYPKSDDMKSFQLIIAIFFVSFAIILVPALAATADIAVQTHEIDPAVLMFGDEATVKITVKNTGTDAVSMKSAIMYADSDDLTITENPHQMIGDIGPTHTRDFTFTIKANAKSGIYYPQMIMTYGGEESNPLRYQVPLKIENSPLLVSIKDKPDVFTKGKEETISVIIGNPRQNSVSAVRVMPVGEGFTVSPESYFTGELGADSSTTIAFDITPEEEGEIVFRVEYRNGMNEHASEAVLDVNFGDSKTSPWMILNNLEVTPGMPYKLEGDVYNAGIDDAKSVIITSGEPAVPVDPYRSYVAGALEPDDFMDFEITFDPNGSSLIPVVVRYKDTDGNRYEETVMIDLMALSKSGGEKNGGNAGGDDGLLIPIVITLAAIVVAVLLLYRFGYISRAALYLHGRRNG